MRRLTATEVHRILRKPPREVAWRLIEQARRRVSAAMQRRRAIRVGTYPAKDGIRLRDRLAPIDGSASIDALPGREIVAVAEHYLAHRFDLLGSGWVRVAHGVTCRGLEGRRFGAEPEVRADRDGAWLEGRVAKANLATARSIWRMVDPGYEPIDWQLDFKSGYRWDEQTWHGDIRYGGVAGADVKVPWELARSHHLPQLALAHVLERSGRRDVRPAATYAREVRNQILDFAAQNPPGFGVNWACPMDVGIRIVNQLVAYDLLRIHGADVDESFASEFGRIVLSHGRYLAANLEWDPVLRANHYLSDIVGLLFCAAYLPRSPEVDAWLTFGVQELITEVDGQFHREGANFEASTSYHRLSTELVLYATALVCGLDTEESGAFQACDADLVPSPPGLRRRPQVSEAGGDRRSPFPPWYLERIERAAEFTMHATKPDGRVVQVGDNDNGRLLKLTPILRPLRVADARDRYANLVGYSELGDEDVYWVEDHLHHGHILAAVGGLIERPDLVDAGSPAAFETAFVASMAGGRRLPSYRRSGGKGAEQVVVEAKVASGVAYRSPDREVLHPIPSGRGLEGLVTCAYPAFGLYIFRSAAAFVAIRCGSVGQRGNGGHAHNDALSVSVTTDGVDRVCDPGTYLYTPVPEIRNAYRSVRAHEAPQVEGREPGDLDLGLFRLADRAETRCLAFSESEFWGCHRGFGAEVYRRVTVASDVVRVSDWAEGGLELVSPRDDLPVSEGYGIILGEGMRDPG